MKKISWMIIVLLGALSAGAATITVGSTATDWAVTDLQTISPAQADHLGYDLKETSTNGMVQSFTATADMTVASISIMAQRLAAGKDFGVDVYEFFASDGSTPEANPDKFRLTNATRSSLIKSYSLNSAASIGSPVGLGEGQFNVVLEEAEQFDITAGHAYGIHIYSKVVGGTSDRVLLWNRASTSAYAGGTLGVPGASTVAARDLGVAITAAPEPAAFTLDADADTYVSGHQPTSNFGTEARLQIRSYDNNSGTLRALAAYVRFDLSAYAAISNDASFTVTAQSGSQTWNSTQVEVYGLPDVAGLTAQGWSETGLTYGTTGSEWANPAVSGADPFNTNDLVFLGNLPAGGPDDTVTFTGAALDAFLDSRAGQGATLLLVQPYKADNTVKLHSSDATTNTPVLSFNAELEENNLGEYDEWIADYSVGSLTNLTDDFDLDGMNHLIEYALGGNPEIDDAADILPSSYMDAASNVFAIVYNRRSAYQELGLTYTVRKGTDLEITPEGWTTNGITVAGVATNGPSFEEVTETVPMDDADRKFLKLEIGLQ